MSSPPLAVAHRRIASPSLNSGRGFACSLRQSDGKVRVRDANLTGSTRRRFVGGFGKGWRDSRFQPGAARGTWVVPCSPACRPRSGCSSQRCCSPAVREPGRRRWTQSTPPVRLPLAAPGTRHRRRSPTATSPGTRSAFGLCRPCPTRSWPSSSGWPSPTTPSRSASRLPPASTSPTIGAEQGFGHGQMRMVRAALASDGANREARRRWLPAAIRRELAGAVDTPYWTLLAAALGQHRDDASLMLEWLRSDDALVRRMAIDASMVQ